MKNIDSVKLKAEFVNEYGERMTMIVDSDSKIWVHHTDCNEDFEMLETFGHTYILNQSEFKALNSFIKMKNSLYAEVVDELLTLKN
jgi:hypothetical protein